VTAEYRHMFPVAVIISSGAMASGVAKEMLSERHSDERIDVW
jgi:hypothetical protein